MGFCEFNDSRFDKPVKRIVSKTVMVNESHSYQKCPRFFNIFFLQYIGAYPRFTSSASLLNASLYKYAAFGFIILLSYKVIVLENFSYIFPTIGMKLHFYTNHQSVGA